MHAKWNSTIRKNWKLILRNIAKALCITGCETAPFLLFPDFQKRARPNFSLSIRLIILTVFLRTLNTFLLNIFKIPKLPLIYSSSYTFPSTISNLESPFRKTNPEWYMKLQFMRSIMNFFLICFIRWTMMTRCMRASRRMKSIWM